MAADATSLGFQPTDRHGYRMLRTEWRMLFHLGRDGAMTARDVCARSLLHETKVSRAVAAPAVTRFLPRGASERDRREAVLRLTDAGMRTCRNLSGAARAFDAALMDRFTPDAARVLRDRLHRLAGL